MTATEPQATNLADLYELAPLDWADVRRPLEANLTQEPGTGGPDHDTFWLATADPDGRPHMTAVGAFWLDGKYYFSAGPKSRKARNVERNPDCALGVAVHGYDVALEGHAHRVTDDAMLQKLAGVFAVADGGFTHEFSAPSAGPPTWYVYETTLETVYAVATKEPGGATRWSF
jgi:Pyridoxamine 5'-phosphate oxidase